MVAVFQKYFKIGYATTLQRYFDYWRCQNKSVQRFELRQLDLTNEVLVDER